MNSFLSYVGGKSKLADKIVAIMPKHKLYCEVFAGAAWVYFRKEPSMVEVINDKNAELVTLYRVIRYHLPEFIRQYDDIIVSRDEFDRLKAQPPSLLTDIQRAVRYYYLLRLAYCSKVVNPSFTLSRDKRIKLRTSEIEGSLKHIHERLNGTAVENLNYDKAIEKYDTPDSLFYLDPPYWNFEEYYGKDIFGKQDFNKIADICRHIKGKCIISINDVPEIRKIFDGFNIREEELTYSLGAKPTKAKELVITNF